MKFQKPEFESEKLEVLDIIAASKEEQTDPQPETTTLHDPYEPDKW